MQNILLPAEIDPVINGVKKFSYILFYTLGLNSRSRLLKEFLFNKYLYIYGVSKGTCQGGFL